MTDPLAHASPEFLEAFVRGFNLNRSETTMHIGTNTEQFREGDVVRYSPTDTWCREQYAIARTKRLWHGAEYPGSPPAERLVLVDTYWGTSYSDSAKLSSAEVDTAELLFNLDEVTIVASEDTWMRYPEADRFLFTEQHGLTRKRFVRTGAEYDRDAELALQQSIITEALARRDSAISDVAWYRQRYQEMLADPTVPPFTH